MAPTLSEKEINLFKYLNRKNYIKTKSSVGIQYLKSIMKLLNLDSSPFMVRYLYKLLYDPIGDYKDLTLDELYDRVLRTKTPAPQINHSDVTHFVGKKLPFKSSGLFGNLRETRSGEIVYVVKSGNYPILVYRDGLWFYDPPTNSSHIFSAYPSSDVNSHLVKVQKTDIEDILYSISPISNETFLKHRKEEFPRIAKSLLSPRKKNIKPWSLYGTPNVRIKFKLLDIRQVEDVTNIDIIVYGVYQGQRPLNYEMNRNWGITKEHIEDLVIYNFVTNIVDYLPPQKIEKYFNTRQIPKDGYIKFNVFHEPLPSQ
jgi:hypothetical protein